MKKLTMAFVLVLFICGAALAQSVPSAKFAAVWSDQEIIANSAASTSELCGTVLPGIGGTDTKEGALLATIKMPESKELLAGISAESKILLDTVVKSKSGYSATAMGEGSVAVNIYAKNVATGVKYAPVPSGVITLNARVQQLTAALGGVLLSCTDTNGDGTITASECQFTEEEIGLLTENASANHFNVLFPNLPQGTYEIRANFTVLSTSTATTTSAINACAYASSKVTLGNRIVTLQDVRAVKDSVEPVVVD